MRSSSKKTYIRDGRAPTPKSEVVSRVMSSNRAKHTGPEVKLRKELRRIGEKEYVLHAKSVPGRPDIVYQKQKLAVFVHGCFWHHCPKCYPQLPATHRNFWRKKFLRNRERDQQKTKELKKSKWKVLVIWEHEIRSNVTRAAARIARKLHSSK